VLVGRDEAAVASDGKKMDSSSGLFSFSPVVRPLGTGLALSGRSGWRLSKLSISEKGSLLRAAGRTDGRSK
jgi:hypothetical protein